MVGNAYKTNDELIKIIKETEVDTSYAYESDRFLDERIGFLSSNCEHVLDVGKCSRDRFKLFHKDQITTVDINQYDGYPDVVDDLCNINSLKWGSFDGIICMSVLEHVYAPHLAVENLRKLLKKGGYCLIHVPFFYRYHGSLDLKMQDYYRFSRDGVAYLFRDFGEVTIYPIRGSHSSIFNLFRFWKPRIEKIFGQSANKVIDKIGGLFSRGDEALTQVSGFYIWARK